MATGTASQNHKILKNIPTGKIQYRNNATWNLWWKLTRLHREMSFQVLQTMCRLCLIHARKPWKI